MDKKQTWICTKYNSLSLVSTVFKFDGTAEEVKKYMISVMERFEAAFPNTVFKKEIFEDFNEKTTELDELFGHFSCDKISINWTIVPFDKLITRKANGKIESNGANVSLNNFKMAGSKYEEGKIEIKATSIEDAFNKIIKEYEKSEVCIEELLDQMEIQGLSVEDNYKLYTKVMNFVENDLFIKIREEDKEETYGALIDVVEDWLTNKDIDIPNKERDAEGESKNVRIWGKDYDILRNGFENILTSDKESEDN